VLTNILVRLPLTNDKIMIYDLDNLFENEAIIWEIVQRGFQIIQYADSEIFRFIYESEMKDEKRNKEANNKYFVLVQRDAYVPYDILQHFYSKRISLRDLFPKLSHVVVKEVYADCMERLYDVYQNYEGEELGDDGTKNYLLNSVYGIYVEQIEEFYGPGETSRLYLLSGSFHFTINRRIFNKAAVFSREIFPISPP
jgi:hypothetical protein